MTESIQQIVHRLERLPDAIRERMTRKIIHQLDTELRDEAMESEPAFVSVYDAGRDIFGSFTGPEDLSYNPRHMEGFGNNSAE